MLSKVFMRKRWAGLAIVSLLSGCTAISDCKYEVSQKIRTKQAWHEYDGCHEQCFTLDYRSGWKAGYYDVVTGGDGCPPLIAPKKYWKPPVFIEHDPGRRNDWYCGYQDGAACAKCQPDHHYLQVFAPPAYCPAETVSFSALPPSVPQTLELPAPMSEQPSELQDSTLVPVTEAPASDSLPEVQGVVPETASDDPVAAEVSAPTEPQDPMLVTPSDDASGSTDLKDSVSPEINKAKKYEADPEQSSSQDAVIPDRFPIELVVAGRKFDEKLANANLLRRIAEQHSTTSANPQPAELPISIVAQ